MSKRNYTAQEHTDQPTHPPTRTKVTGCGIGNYTVICADGASVTFDAAFASKSNLFEHLDSGTDIPLNQFHSTSALALQAIVRAKNESESASIHFTPELYSMTLHLCDYLQMNTEISLRFLALLEPPLQSQDSLVRLRQCHHHLPVLPRLFHDCYDMFNTEEEAYQVVSKIISSAPHELSYYELSLCDGQYSPFTTQLHLHRYARDERDRRRTIHAAAVSKTASLRALLTTTNNNDDAVAQETLRVSLWAEHSGTTNATRITAATTTEFLDDEMWKAISQGRVDVAQRLLDLGANPAMAVAPEFESEFEDAPSGEIDFWEYENVEMTDYPSSLMLATKNNDMQMVTWLLDVAGVSANLCTPTYLTYEKNTFGGLNALWCVQSMPVMQLLLSRGADPTQACCIYVQGNNSDHWQGYFDKEPLLLQFAHEMQQLLVRHGADPNSYFVNYGSGWSPSQAEPESKIIEQAYFPSSLILPKHAATTTTTSSSSDFVHLEWCKELLTKYGANPNWPIGVTRAVVIDGREECEVPKGLTVLLRAVIDDDIAVARLLLQHGANPNQYEKAADENGTWRMDDENLYDLLYFHRPAFQHSCGLFADAADKLQCPLSVALKKNNKDMVKLLNSYGACADLPIPIARYYDLHPQCIIHDRRPCYWYCDSLEVMKCDSQLMLRAIAKDGNAPLRYACDELKNNKEFMMTAVTLTSGGAFLYASNELKHDCEITMAAVSLDGNALKYASNAMRNEKDVVMTAVALDGNALQYASNAMQNEKDVVMVAMEHWDTSLKKDEFYSGNFGHPLGWASDTLKDDYNVTMAAVTRDGEALKYASARLQNNRDVVLLAVKQNGTALEFASASLRADKEIVKSAMSLGNTHAFEYASEHLRSDKQFVVEMVLEYGEINDLPDEIIDDSDVVAAVNLHMVNYQDYYI